MQAFGTLFAMSHVTGGSACGIGSVNVPNVGLLGDRAR
jgi:hypothetical protein